MPIHSPSLVELHAFLAVARTGSFRRAAEELSLTQAAVSRAVLRLEETLGQDVFRRASGGVALTPAGQQLRKLTQAHVEGLEAAALRLRRRPERLRLRLSVVPSVGALWLMPRLDDFRVRHPEVEIELRQYFYEEDYSREDVDLWIDLKRHPEYKWPRRVSAKYLLGGDVVPVCVPRLARPIRSAQQLFSLPLLYHSNYPENWRVWAKAAGVAGPAQWKGTGFDLVVYMLDAARAGMGVAMVPLCLAESDLASGRLVRPDEAIGDTGRGYFVCRPRHQSTHPAAELFCRWLEQQAARPPAWK